MSRICRRPACQGHVTAWPGELRDLLACHRLGRLIGRGGTLIEALVAVAIDGRTAWADVAFLDRCKEDAKRLQTCLRDLQELPPLPEIADKVNLCERFVHLDIMMRVDRQGLKYLESLSGGPDKESSLLEHVLGDLVLQGIDWDPALINHNQLYDRLARIARRKVRALREEGWEEIHTELKTMKEKVDSGELAQAILEAKGDAKARGKVVGDILICLMTPAVGKVQTAVDRVQQFDDNLCVGFALAWYRCHHGRYPKELDALAPKYLAQIPQDMFAGKPLIYRPSEKGFLLYSVGVNGEDEDGRWYDDDPPGDDLVVRIPLPDLPRK